MRFVTALVGSLAVVAGQALVGMGIISVYRKAPHPVYQSHELDSKPLAELTCDDALALFLFCTNGRVVDKRTRQVKSAPGCAAEAKVVVAAKCDNVTLEYTDNDDAGECFISQLTP